MKPWSAGPTPQPQPPPPPIASTLYTHRYTAGTRFPASYTRSASVTAQQTSMATAVAGSDMQRQQQQQQQARPALRSGISYGGPSGSKRAAVAVDDGQSLETIRRQRLRSQLLRACCLATCLAILVLLALVVYTAVVVSRVLVTIDGVVALPITSSLTTADGFAAPLEVKFKVSNANTFALSVDEMSVFAYYRITPREAGRVVAMGKLIKTSVPASTPSYAVTFPIVAVYGAKTDPDGRILADVAQKCGPADSKKNVAMDVRVDVAQRVLGVSISRWYTIEDVQFPCPAIPPGFTQLRGGK